MERQLKMQIPICFDSNKLYKKIYPSTGKKIMELPVENMGETLIHRQQLLVLSTAETFLKLCDILFKQKSVQIPVFFPLN